MLAFPGVDYVRVWTYPYWHWCQLVTLARARLDAVKGAARG